MKQITPAMQSRFNVRNITHQIEMGGRSSTKTSYASIVVGSSVAEETPCGAVVVRKHHNKLYKTVYKEALRGLDRIGLQKKVHFKETKSPMEITMKHPRDKKKHEFSGNPIYFTGADNIDDTKGIIDVNVPIKVLFIDEITEFFKKSYEDGAEQLRNIVATFARGNNDWFRVIYAFNPPRNPKHAVYK